MINRTQSHSVKYILLLLVPLLACPSPAQPSEAVNPKSAKYHGILKKRPDSGYLFDRFYNAWLDTGSLAGLEAFLVAENAGPDRTTADALILGFYHAKQGNDPLALDTLAKALEADPNVSTGWFEKAKILARYLNFEGALADLDRALAANPKADQKIEIATFKGRLLVRSGNHEDALALLKQLLSEHPGDEELHEDLVELLIDEGLFEEAIESMKALIAKTRDPYQQVLRQLRVGDIYQRIRKRGEALAAYEGALRKTGRDTWIEKEIFAQIEQVYRREDDLTGLAGYFETVASAQGPLRPGLVQRHARVLLEMKEQDKALRLLNDLLARTPGDRELRKAYVDLLRQAGDPGRAVVQMEALARQNPEDAELLISLANLQNQADQTGKALSTLATYLSQAGDEDYAWLRVARLQETFGKPPEAEATYRALISKNPGNPGIRETFAAFLHRTGHRGEAARMWKELAASGELDQAFRATRALLSRQEYPAAFEALQQRYAEFQDDPIYLALLCRVAIRLGKVEEASEWAVRRVRQIDQPVDMAPAVRDAATLLIQAGKAEEMAEKLAAGGAKTDQDRCLLAELYQQLQGDERADAVLKGNSELILGQRIRLHKLRGNWRSAAEATRELLLTRSGQRKSSTLRDLINLYRRADLPEEAARWLPEWKAASPTSIDPWLIETALAEDQGNLEGALKVLESAARKFGDNTVIRGKLAARYQQAGRNADARRIYTTLYDEADKLSDKLRWVSFIASIDREEDKIDRLIEQFEERRRNNRGSVAPLLALAEIHRTNENYAERRKALMEASQRRSQDVDLILEIAQIEEREGQWEDALKSLKRARALDDSPDIVRLIAALQLEHGEAEDSYRLLNEIGSDADADTFVRLALAIAVRRDWQQLNRFLSTRVDEFPKDYRIHYLRGIALEEASENDAAADCFLAVLGIDEEVPAALATAGVPNPQAAAVGEGMPPGLHTFTDLANEVFSAYRYRREAGPGPGVTFLPKNLPSAHGMALAHLSQLKRLLNAKEADRIDRQAGAIAGREAVALCQIDFNPSQPQSADTLLARNPDLKELLRQEKRISYSDMLAELFKTSRAFHGRARKLVKEGDPANFVNFLEQTIAEKRKTDQFPRNIVIVAVSKVDIKLLKHLAFPPIELHRFPYQIISGLNPEKGEWPGDDWAKKFPPDKYDSLHDCAKDPILRYLIAISVGKDKATLAKDLEDIMASPSIHAITKAQLLASWHTRRGEYPEVVATLEKARRLPMPGYIKKRMDIAMVTAAMELDNEDLNLLPLVKAGRGAALRLARRPVRIEHRQELIGAMKTLGMASTAENEERKYTTIAAMTPSDLMGTTTIDDSSVERTARLVRAGKKEAAVQEYATRLRILMPQIISSNYGWEGGGANAAKIVREAEENGLGKDVYRLFQREASLSDVKQLEYAGAAFLFKEEATAIEQLTALFEKHPGNFGVKTRLALTLIKRGEYSRIPEILASMDGSDIARFETLLQSAIPIGSVPLEKEVRTFEMLLPFVEDYGRFKDWREGWALNVMKRILVKRKEKNIELGHLYQANPGREAGGVQRKRAAYNAQRWALHDRFVAEYWRSRN